VRRQLIDPRIARMARRDKQLALVAIVALWAVYAFVFAQLLRFGQGVEPILLALVGTIGAAVLLLNTASVLAMVKHRTTASERERVYGPELRHLDQL
jgi:hypothetical protein